MTPTWQSDCGTVRLYLADCMDVLPELSGVDAVVTSPPYAEQRETTYGGIPELEYPAWITSIMSLAFTSVKPTGSALVNIKEHRTEYGMSDYVHRSRLAVRDAGFCEVDELLWIKPDAMPTAPNSLPRRGWERILWFAKTPTPDCFAKDESRTLTKFNKTLNRYAEKSGATGTGTQKMPAHPRKLNYVSIPVGGDVSVDHPAKYPEALAAWMVELVTKESQTTLDPFTGSGTTGVAAIRLNRSFIGIEREPKYFDIARRRIEDELTRKTGEYSKQPEKYPLLAGVT